MSSESLLLLAAVLTTLPACNCQISPPSSTPRSSSTTVSPSGGGGGGGGSSTPVDVTAGSGGNATFTCSGQFVEWKVYTNPPKLLFSSRDNVGIEDTNKYSIDGQWNLVVKNLDPNNDGETYECRNGPTSYSLANLVVIDENQFFASISPPVQMPANVVTFNCVVSYGGPAADSSAAKPLELAQDPDVTLTLSDEYLPEAVVVYELPSGASGIHTKVVTMNHTIVATDAGKSLKCTVRSLSYTKTVTQDLNIPSLTTLPVYNPQNVSTRSSTTTTVSPSSSTPVDVTAGSGGNATFTCSGPFVEWKVYTNPPHFLFSSRDSVEIVDTNKYSIAGQWNLVVKNLDPNNDGETYECRNGPTTYTLANLVVIDEHQFDVSISPSNQVLHAGNVVTFSCSVSYGGPTADSSATRPLQPAQDPDLTLTLSDGGNLPETVVNYMQPSGASGIHTKIATVNHTIQSSDAGKSVVCTLRSLTYTKTATIELNMLYAPNRFINSLNGTGSQQYPIQVSAGLRVRCYANGNPLPTVQWIPLTDGVPSPAPSNSRGYTEMIVPETPQTQKWQCSAYNNQGNSSSTYPYIIYLAVLSPLSTTQSVSRYSTPVDVTAATGRNATFICSGPFVEWTVYKHPPVLLFSSLVNVDIQDTNKYSIVGQYNLVVKNIEPNNDGWTYGCRNSPTTTTYANLVVIDERKLTINISPSGQAMQEGDVVTFTCSIQYGGPTTDKTNIKPLAPDQDPYITLTLDGESIPEITFVEYLPPSGASGIHTKTAICNHTIVSCDDGKSLICSITSLDFAQSKSFLPPLFVVGSSYYNCSDNATSTSTMTGNTQWVIAPLCLIQIMVAIIGLLTYD